MKGDSGESGFRERLERWLAGDIGEDAAETLLEDCRAEAERGRAFGRQTEVDRLLEIALRENEGGAFKESVLQRIENSEGGGVPFVESVMGKVGMRRRKRWLPAVAGMAAAVAAGVGFLFFSDRPAADLYRGDTAAWFSEVPPDRLRAGQRLKLERGLAEVHFRNGAELILEGPADLEIQGKGRGFLHRGRVSVRVPERASGFTLESPGGRVVDLGTAFGVHVAAEGTTEAEVFEGKVQVRPRGKSEQVVLAENEKFTSDRSGWRKSTGINVNAFVTSLPPQQRRVPRFVHWPFEEGGGFSTIPDGELAGDGLRPAELRDFTTGSAGGSQWITGPYGMALSFDGVGQALETFFPGPVGDAARTVAFWVRLPEDFDPEQGYGIISWGDLEEPGNAWQISVNPYEEDGPVGKLRAGVYPSLVTGSTDLRDGKWHHCAVVLYKDERNRQRVPILLYVDGKMEATAMKGVISRIHTSEGARSVWIAKSLRHDEPNRSKGTGFFRGDLDEIYIFEGALNPRQIEHLMKTNLPSDGGW